ncbi:hypothetical protein MG293_005857 [Ovis ammon polii]|uniref:MAGE domain-containing protein n=1 Tax=Ovis ammon polii TaxID=230172 RepID=A0AAD4YGC0_OVIAM|nr:hypothetical protein MG293_005857 [Ovis ammon polii]
MSSGVKIGRDGSPLSSPATEDHQELEGAMAPSSPDAGPSCAGSEGAQGPEEESAGASQAAPATQSTRKDPLARKAKILVEILLEKYTKKEAITQNALMKTVSRKYRQHFPEILSTACEHVELVFGLEMKEVDHSKNIYTLISKLNLGGNDCPSGEGELPKSGLLMVLLGVIFMNGNRATEEEIWEFLSMLGIYAGRRHWIFGEPRRLITKDLVQKEYLNYRQVPNSDPPRYEFLWGLRACAETSKMKGSPPSSLAAGDRQELQGAMAPSSPDAEASCAGADQGAQGPEEESADAARAALLARSIRKDPLMRKASMVMDFLLERYTKKEPITKNAMLNVIGRKYKQHFPEILSRASERVELVFGLELKEVDCSRNIYALVNKFTLGVEEGSSDEEALPKSGLLMALLGVIFMKGNRATEEEIWDFLNVLGIYAGRKHSIFGEPRKLITKDLVQKGYLNYRKVPNSDPPIYEFLWGPRSYAETNKMKVLEVLAKIQDTVPSSFPDLYDEALRDQAFRAGLRGIPISPAMAEASAPSRAKSYSSSHI